MGRQSGQEGPWELRSAPDTDTDRSSRLGLGL